ncbi:MAG: hypothetical protein ACJATQ_001138 [Cellvibrionaceae bacterium]|jgi:hypothetical protein
MSDKSADANPELVILRSNSMAFSGFSYYLFLLHLMGNIWPK